MSPAELPVKSRAPSPLETPTPGVGNERSEFVTRVIRGPDTPAEPHWQDPNWPRIRGYEVLSVIGTGGMGIVYQARQRDLQRTVAIKTLRGAGLADQEFRNRFQAEAKAVARLQHPNIVQVFDVGTVDLQIGDLNPSPYIALEFVDGGALLQLTDKPQAPQHAAALMEKLARAVHSAHRLGVIHRDLKPANVLLTRDGEPKIADFGVAKQLAPEFDASGRFATQAGTIIGTPEYMAPEQAAAGAATPAADIYALGVILYELLTARVPFQAASPIETIELVRRQEPVSPRRLQPGVPRDLETICLKCLEKEPTGRYASAEALADDLRCYLDDRPIRARPVSAAERAARWARRNPLAGILMAAIVLVGVAGVTGILWKWREAEEHADAAERAFVEVRNHVAAERWERYRANIAASVNALQTFSVDSARRTLDAAPEDHRNWEWRHLHSRLDLAHHVFPWTKKANPDGIISAGGRCVILFDEDRHAVLRWDPAKRTLVSSIDQVPELFGARFSPDGRIVAYAAGNIVLLRDLDSDRIVHRLNGHQNTPTAMCFSDDGKYIATAGDDEHMRIWNVATGKLHRTIPSPGPNPICLHLSPDGRRLTAAPRHSGAFHVWDVASGQALATLPGHDPGSLHVQWSANGERILIIEGFPRNTMRLWDAATGRLIRTMHGHGNAIIHCAFSPDGSRLATCSRDQTVALWDGATGQHIATLRGHVGVVYRVAFHPDGKRLLSASQDQTVRIWDAVAGELLTVLHGHTGEVYSAAFTADGAWIVSAARDGTVRLWDMHAAEMNGGLRGHTTFVYSVAFHPNGRSVASASWDGTVRLWDATSGRQLAVLPHGDKTIVTSVAIHPAGKVLASRARDGVHIWDLATARELQFWKVAGDSWRDSRVAYNHDGNLLATGSRDREIRIWDTNRGAEVAVLRGHKDEIRDLAFSPDGRWLASAGEQEDRAVRIWDVERREQIQVLQGHGAAVYAVAFNRAGTILASGAIDGSVRLWDVASWKEIAALEHSSNVYSVAFNDDGSRLACSCADNSIRFWDTKTHQEVAELRGHTSYVHQVAFSPDGSRLVSASGDGTLRVWDTVRPQDRVD